MPYDALGSFGPSSPPEGRIAAEAYSNAAREKAELEVGRTKAWDDWFADERCGRGMVADWIAACVDYRLALAQDAIADALCRMSERWDRVVDAYVEYREADAMFEISVLREMAETGDDDEF